MYTVVSTDEKRKIAEAAGADGVFSYDEFGDKLHEVTDGVGVDVAYDAVGADTFDMSLASVRVRGMIVLFGAASGPVPPFDLQRPQRRRRALHDPSSGALHAHGRRSSLACTRDLRVAV